MTAHLPVTFGSRFCSPERGVLCPRRRVEEDQMTDPTQHDLGRKEWSQYAGRGLVTEPWKRSWPMAYLSQNGSSS
jgi:hypothetical protein